tara:strand:- start:9162 stop:9347 length:186 start_codon:yes stop_codon:yes gene_type:complete
MAKANLYNKTMGSIAFIGLLILVGASVYGVAHKMTGGPKAAEKYGCGKHGKEGYATKCCGM